MVRPPSVDSNGMKKGAWSEEEDNKLRAYVQRYGHWNWRELPKYAGLARCGKSCRLRWVNYLKPGVRRGKFTKEEEDLVTKLHSELGNKWSVIAAKLPGRTDNEVKNFYHTRIEKKKGRGHAKDVLERGSRSHSTQESTLLERESSLEYTQESALSSGLDTHDTSSYQITPSEDLWSDLFQPSDANTDRFPPLMEDGFFYPDFRYSELSCSDSTSEFADPNFFWDESSSSMSSYQNEERSNEMGGVIYNPLFDQCFDYGMDLFS